MPAVVVFLPLSVLTCVLIICTVYYKAFKLRSHQNMKFSDRYGYTKVNDVIQIESMDIALRNSLWSLLCLFIWNDVKCTDSLYGRSYLNATANKSIYLYCQHLWLNYFKKPIDTLNTDWEKVLPVLRNYFKECDWFEIYNFIEFTANNYNENNFKDNFIKACNVALEREVSAYRFVDDTITRVTDKVEIDEIELALNSTSNPVQTQLKLALDHLSNRQTPDYRNSIKESISAVEGIAREITGDSKATLGTLVSKLKANHDLHPALANAYGNLYGYTSDNSGIRHALSEKVEITFEDAKYFLVICSAFINYVTAKNSAQ